MTRAAEDVEKSESSSRVTGAGVMRCVAVVDRPVVHQGAKHEVPVDPAVPLPGMCLREVNTHVRTKPVHEYSSCHDPQTPEDGSDPVSINR